MRYFIFLVLLATLPYPVFTESLIDLLPSCMSDCTTRLLDQSTCSATNTTCICTDTQLMTNIQACTAGVCTVKQSLSTANATASFCNAPVRSRAKFLNVIVITFGLLALFFVVLRLVIRFLASTPMFGLDDMFIVFATVPMVLMMPNQLIATKAGLARDLYTVKFSDIEIVLKTFYVDAYLYDTTITITKISILAFYLRIFPSRSFKISTYILMGFCAAFLCSMLPAAMFQCWPISYTWKAWTGEANGKCLNLRALAYASAASNITLDVAIILLPIRDIFGLNLSQKNKLQVLSMFAVGTFVTIVSIVRLKSLVKVAHTTNFTWDYVDSVYLSVLEADVGVICACMPTMRLLLRHIAPRWFGTTLDASSGASAYMTISKTHHDRTRFSHRAATISKTVSNSTSVLPKSADSDVIELVEVDDKIEAAESPATVDFTKAK